MKERFKLHRKLWEFVYIAQVLYENNCLFDGSHGLGFAVGKEPLPALFSSLGCKILATDLDAEEANARAWINTNQNPANNIEALNEMGICKPEVFKKNVTYRSVNMNEIPEDLNGKFNFNWSACSVEHIGGLDKSLDFLVNNLKTLKSGGIAVHTTEFNLSSNEDTCLDPGCVMFRRRDIEAVAEKLRNLGHYVYPLDWRIGGYVNDRYIDVPPYSQDKHLRLKLSKYASTSIGLIVRKK
ncbi:hypothetical protein FACS1894152_6370 [Bacilli bacterium]|nr:hypothetical protein FACS1894152_6370 [Bacilli bacterium]